MDADAAQRANVLRRLYTATVLCTCFLIVEVVGGYLSGSLAILSDAAHLFADLASFGIAIVAAHLASLPSTDQHTFGLKRSESLAALISMLSLALVSIGLAFEAVRRIYRRESEVDGTMMSVVAAIGVLVNIVLAMVLGVEHHVHLPGADHGHSHDHGHCKNEMDHHSCAHDKHDAKASCGGHDHASEKHDKPDGHAHRHDHKNDDHGHRHDHIHKVRDHSHDHKHQDHGHQHDHNRDCHGHHHDGLEAGVEHSHDHETTKLIGKDTHGSQYSTLHLDELPPEDVPRNVNLHAAYLHVMGDLAQSAGVLIAGMVIWFRPQWHIVDPLCTLLFCSFVFYSTLGVLRSSVSVLLEEVPPNIRWRDMLKAIQGVEGVENVHDLHIWSISHGHPSLSVHCSTAQDPQRVLEQIYSAIKAQGIEHATIQVQTNGEECVTCHGQSGCHDDRGAMHTII